MGLVTYFTNYFLYVW